MANGTDHYKEILEDEKHKLEQGLRGHGRMLDTSGDWIATPAEHDNSNADPNEMADRVEDFEVNVATLRTLEERYNEVLIALAKIADGTYGTCEISGEQIEKERLMANAAARTCIAHMNDPLPE